MAAICGNSPGFVTFPPTISFTMLSHLGTSYFNTVGVSVNVLTAIWLYDSLLYSLHSAGDFWDNYIWHCRHILCANTYFVRSFGSLYLCSGIAGLPCCHHCRCLQSECLLLPGSRPRLPEHCNCKWWCVCFEVDSYSTNNRGKFPAHHYICRDRILKELKTYDKTYTQTAKNGDNNIMLCFFITLLRLKAKE